MDEPRRHPCALLRQWAVIAVLIILAYAPTFTGDFLLDDHVLVENNPFVRQGHSLGTYLSQEDGILDRNNWDDAFHTGYYRPLINLTYFIDYTLWGMNPAGFRASNLIFHILACCTLYIVLLRSCANPLAALGVSLLFALHPVNTESVSWIASRNNILATFFSLAAFYCHIDPRQNGRLFRQTLAVALFGLAIFCKEFGVMLLPVIFLYNRLRKDPKESPGNELIGYLPFMVVLAVYLWARTSATGSIVSQGAAYSMGWRIAFAPYLIAYHLSLICFPVGLHNFFVTYPEAFWSRELVYGLLVAGLLGALLWTFRRRHLFVFGVLSFLVGLFPILNIIPTASATLVAMRWVYFPFAFLCMALCPLAGKHGGKKTAIVIICAIVASGIYTYRLNRYHWHDEAAFFRNEVLVHRNNLYAGGLAEWYWKNGDRYRAETYFKKGIAAVPQMIETRINYAAMLIETGRSQEALVIIHKALGMTMSRKSRGGLYSNLGMALTRLNRLDEAVAALESAVGYTPDMPDILNNLGTVYGMRGEYEEAAAVLTRGLAKSPDSVGLKRNLAVTHIRAGDHRSAVEILSSIPAAERKRDPSIRALLREARAKSNAGAPSTEHR
ncbi:MAG: tetratricopeptide repeat protein [Desulfobacterales bacterium]|nr:tetratricopeptide repeat protein [Desulfobacterales bacterium]